MRKNKFFSLSEHLMPKKSSEFSEFMDLPEYEKLILQAECLELRAAKLLKYARKARDRACGILIKGEK